MSVPVPRRRGVPAPPGGHAIRLGPRTGDSLPVVSEVSAGGVVVDTTQVDLPVAIIARRNRGGRLEWCLPKGHLEQSESVEQAAIREVAEETGITAQVAAHLGVIDYWFTGQQRRIHKVVHHFLLTAVGGDLTTDNDPDQEAEDAAWVPLGDLPSRLAYPNERRLARAAAGIGESDMIARTWRAVFVAVLVALALPTAGAFAAVDPTTPVASAIEPAPEPIEVVMTTISPQLWSPGTDLVVTASLTNTTAEPITDAVVALCVTRYPIKSRSYLWEWAEPDPTVPGYVGSIENSIALTEPLAPGETREVTLLLAGTTLSSNPGYWGPHGLAVEARNANGDRIGLDRSFIPWEPANAVEPVKVTVVVPIAGPAEFASDITSSIETSATTQSNAGSPTVISDDLVDLLTAADATIAVDPQLLAGSSASASDLLRLVRSHESFPLLYGDLDAAAAIRASRLDLLTDAASFGDSQWTSQVGREPDVAVVYPGAGLQDSQVYAGLVATFPDAAVMAAPGEITAPTLTYTPSGYLPSERILSPDETLSELLAYPATSSPATAAQRLLAELMVIAGERPTQSRQVLITVPRDWTPDLATAGAQFAALDAASWTHTAPLADLLSSVASFDHSNLVDEAIDAAELAPATVASLLNSRAAVAEFSPIFGVDDSLLTEFDLQLRNVLSVSARDATGRDAAVDELLALPNWLTSQLTTVGESSINLTSADVDLPIVISNSFDVPVTVTVQLRPTDLSFQVDDQPVVTIPAHSETAVRIPVTAHNNGEIEVDIELLNEAGDVVGTGEQLLVSVHAEWETLFTIIFASAMVLILAFGIVRTIRGHRGTRAEQIEAEQIATHEEEST